MSSVARLVQGSPEWHEHRRRYRNASETPTVVGVSPWQTPYHLWKVKLGLTQTEVTAPMLHGLQTEPAARAAYEALTGEVMQPLVMVDGEYSASLDGITLAGDRVLEIKCPLRGRDSKLWQAVAGGELPEHYRWQVQHQLMVTGAEVADVFVFDGAEGQLLQVTPDTTAWDQIRGTWDAFAKYVATAEPPPLNERDVRIRDDPEWLEAAAKYRELRTAYDSISAKFDAAKLELTRLVTHRKEEGGGVSVTKVWKRGAVDYRHIPQLRDVDVEQYRAHGREELRLSTG